MRDLSVKELEQLMKTTDMKKFCGAANELVQRASNDAYKVLREYVFCTDDYKKRYAISVIFDYPNAIDLIPELENLLREKNTKGFLVNTILEILIKKNIKISEETIIQTLRQRTFDYGWYYQIIKMLEKNERNFDILLALYHKKGINASVRIFMAWELRDFANEKNYMQLVQLFGKDEQSHIRMVACEIADKMNRKDLLSLFKDDKDGHIRKYAMDCMKE